MDRDEGEATKTSGPAVRPWAPPPDCVLAVPDVTLLRFPDLTAMLPEWRIGPLSLAAFGADGFLGWGRKPPARLAARVARWRNRPFWTLEDGFLRSVGLGKAGAPAVSLIVDDLGVYYDASRPSRLETILAQDDLSPWRDRARDIRARLIAERLSKYNHLPDRPVRLTRDGRRNILLVDQVAGDYSTPGALAGPADFARMIGMALREPDARVILRAHPDVMDGRARGSFGDALRDPRLVICNDAVSPHAILDVVDEVWTVSSQLGFDALLRGLSVRCFGVPFYAGWGLTRDDAGGPAAVQALARRRGRRRQATLDLDDLTAAALLLYPLYYDPVRRRRVDIDVALDRLSDGRRHADAWRGETACLGLGWRKRRVFTAYCATPGGRVRFSTQGGPPPDRIVVWGARGEAALTSQQRAHPGLLRAEDGFIRSVGLGGRGIFPLSLCFDGAGLYYDSTRASDLETLLETAEFSVQDRLRAAALRKRIVAARVSKYNLSRAGDACRRSGLKRPAVVVFGQVPDDESIRLGGGPAMSNLDFLLRVRQERPGAHIVFKEHPDLLDGRRSGATDLAQARAIADEVAETGDALDWIDAADEVHVRTSLAGFEALLRDKAVHCHGLPFYAGWGLTHDRVRTARRTRTRSLDELVVGALLRYPTYLDPRSGMAMTAEDAVNLIEQEIAARDAGRG